MVRLVVAVESDFFTGMIDLYCERILDGLLAEPFNLCSNIVYFVVFFLLYRNKSSWPAGGYALAINVLCYQILAVGIGSSLFHSFARFWALLLDVGTISIFILTYVLIYMTLVRKWPPLRVAGVALLFVLLTASLRLVHVPLLNYSEFYLSPLLVVYLLYVDRKGKQGEKLYLHAFATLFMAILFRIVDPLLCTHFPIGTHFLWHVFTGASLYYCMEALRMTCSQVGSQAVRQE